MKRRMRKGAEPDWVGLSCDTDGQTEQRGSQQGQGSNSSHPTPLVESTENPSKCYCLVCCASADFLQLPKVLLGLLISLPVSERSHWKHKQAENGKESREHSGWICVTAEVLNAELLLVYCALGSVALSYHMFQNTVFYSVRWTVEM